MIIFLLLLLAYFAFPFFGYPGYIYWPIYLGCYVLLRYVRFKCPQHIDFWRIVFSSFGLLTLTLSLVGIFFVYDTSKLCTMATQACFYELVLHQH